MIARALRSIPRIGCLSRMNRSRLDFESMRDSLLMTSGDLDLAMGRARGGDVQSAVCHAAIDLWPGRFDSSCRRLSARATLPSGYSRTRARGHDGAAAGAFF